MTVMWQAMQPLNWYPGHMKKTRELIAGHLRLVDAVIEVCDARIPVSSRNPVLAELVAGKDRVLVLNKSDLADAEQTRAWLEAFRRAEGASLRGAIAMNAMAGDGTRALLARLARLAERRDAAKPGRAPLRLMIVGVPNCGKSSLINRLTGRRATQVGDRPGVTRGKQWLHLPNGMQLLDTPGILWPKFEDPIVGRNLAFCGSIKDEIMDLQELGLALIGVLVQVAPELLAARYGLEGVATADGAVGGDAEHASGGAGEDATADEVWDNPALVTMEAIARKRGFLLSGGRVDWERTARMTLDEFRAGKLGRITLEPAPEEHA